MGGNLFAKGLVILLPELKSPIGAIESSQAIHHLDPVTNQNAFVPFGTTDLWGGLSSPPSLKEKPQAGKPAPQCSAVPMGLDFFLPPINQAMNRLATFLGLYETRQTEPSIR